MAFKDDIARALAAGKADLNDVGKVPEEQLPSYVDTIVEVPNKAALPNPGQTGVIYVIKTGTGVYGDTKGDCYRWSGSQHVIIASAQFYTELSKKQNKLVQGRGILLTDIAGNQTRIELSINTFDLKGEKEFYKDLPTTGQLEGDTWYIKNDDPDLEHLKGFYTWMEDAGVGNWVKINTDTQWGKILGDIETQEDLMALLDKFFARDGSKVMTGNIKMGNHKITNLSDPEESGDAVNKRFLEEELAKKVIIIKYVEIYGVDGSTGTLTDDEIKILKESVLNYIWLNGMHKIDFKYRDDFNNKATYSMSDLSSDGIKFHSIEINLSKKTYKVYHKSGVIKQTTTGSKTYLYGFNASGDKVIDSSTLGGVTYVTVSGEYGTLSAENYNLLLSGGTVYIKRDGRIYKNTLVPVTGTVLHYVSHYVTDEDKVVTSEIIVNTDRTWTIQTKQIVTIEELNERILRVDNIGEPSTTTKGLKGQLAFNTTNGLVYKCLGFDGEDYIWMEFGEESGEESGAEPDGKSIIRDKFGRFAVSYGGGYVEALKSLLNNFTAVDRIDNNIAIIESKSPAELDHIELGQTLKGTVVVPDVYSFDFEGVVKRHTLIAERTGDTFEFIGVKAYEDIPGYGVDAYIGQYEDESGETKLIMAVTSGDVSILTSSIFLNASVVTGTFETIKPQVIPVDGVSVIIDENGKLKAVLDDSAIDNLFIVKNKKGELTVGNIASIAETDAYLRGNVFIITSRIVNGTLLSDEYIIKDSQSVAKITPAEGYMNPISKEDISVENATLIDYDNATGTLVIGNPTGTTGNVKITAVCPEYSIFYVIHEQVTYGSLAGMEVIYEDEQATVNFVPDDKYTYPIRSNIVVNNARIHSYDETTGTLVIEYPQGSVDIIAQCPIKTLPITINKLGCDVMAPNRIQILGSAVIQIIPQLGYKFPKLENIEVINATIDSYDESTGILTIINPTNNVIINITCSSDALCFTANESDVMIGYTKNGTVSCDIQASYDGINWFSWTGNDLALSNIGDKLYVKNNTKTLSTSSDNYFKFNVAGNVSISGDCSSLVNFTSTGSDYLFYNLFKDCIGITSIEELKLGFKDVKGYMYSNMFNGCTGLTTIPATLLSVKSPTGSCAYAEMFRGCTGLTTLPEGLLAIDARTTLSYGIYYGMFRDCTELVTVPTNLLPATKLAEQCYKNMFYGCEKLTTLPTLPARDLTGANYCYHYMFYGCKSITEIPEDYLPATTLSTECYSYMFYGTGITTLSEGLLPAMTLSEECYKGMFASCKSLTSLPNNLLQSTRLSPECYSSMFTNCILLKSVPELPATDLIDGCYYRMFRGCSSLSISDVEGAKIFTCTSDVNEAVADMFTDTEGPFTGTPVVGKTYYMSKPLMFTATEANSTVSGTIVNSLDNSIDLEYSTDDCVTWNTFLKGTSGDAVTITLAKVGDSVYIRNKTDKLSNGDMNYFKFKLTGKIAAKYSVNSLINNKGVHAYCFCRLFSECSSLETAPRLPATTLKTYCYSHMFSGCTNLKTAPELPATALAEWCYYQMFNGCTSLTSAPELPATTLAAKCYYCMFSSCEGLTSAPALPAKTLAESCYEYMFWWCTSLISAPELPATTLAKSCYRNMFMNCHKLTPAPSLPATTLAESCYSCMFGGCKSLTSAPSLPAKVLAPWCYEAMFSSCEGLTSAPTLPATTLAEYCYHNMFQGCTGLTSAPYLPATALVLNCYSYMFNGCTGIKSVPSLPAPALVDTCYVSMFRSCSSLKVNENGSGNLIFTCPSTPSAFAATLEMFYGTGGSFTGTPASGNRYYYY